MIIDTSLLYSPVREIAEVTLFEAEKQGVDIFISCACRTEKDQIAIYGHEQWTVHYIGCAIDFNPHLKCKLADFKKEFDLWPLWNKLQCDIAVKCGFDAPQQWQLDRDRPHCQKLFGIPESVLKQLWYASKGNKEEIWHYIDLHKGVVS